MSQSNDAPADINNVNADGAVDEHQPEVEMQIDHNFPSPPPSQGEARELAELAEQPQLGEETPALEQPAGVTATGVPNPSPLRAPLQPLDVNVLQGAVFRASRLLGATPPARRDPRQPDVPSPTFPLAGIASPAARNAAVVQGNDRGLFRFSAIGSPLPVRALSFESEHVFDGAGSSPVLLAPVRSSLRGAGTVSAAPQDLVITDVDGHSLSHPGTHHRALAQARADATAREASQAAGLADVLGAPGSSAAHGATAELAARLATPGSLSDSGLAGLLLQSQLEERVRLDRMMNSFEASLAALARPRQSAPRSKMPKQWEGKTAYSGRMFLLAMATWFAANRVAEEDWVPVAISNLSTAMQQWLTAICQSAEPPVDPLFLSWQTLAYLIKYGRSSSAPHLVARDRMQEVPIRPGRLQEWADEMLVLREDCNTGDTQMSDLDFVYHIRRAIKLQRIELMRHADRAPDGQKWQDPIALLNFLVEMDQDEPEPAALGQKRRRDDDDDDQQGATRDSKRRTRGRGRGRGKGKGKRRHSRSRSPAPGRFQGFCNWCHIQGHKEADCRGKKAGKPKASGPTPNSGASGSGSGKKGDRRQH